MKAVKMLGEIGPEAKAALPALAVALRAMGGPGGAMPVGAAANADAPADTIAEAVRKITAQNPK
jgi:hypothetical protein